MEIRMEHLSKYYDRKVLDDLSLDLKNIHALGIIGKSGCGKSTLLRLLAGLEKPEEGRIWINGTLLEGKNVKKYQDGIGYVFQKHNLFPHLSLKENIVLILNKIRKIPCREAKNHAEEILTKVGLKEEMNKKPDAVSGGQAQRASIARALAADPKLIFLDEPTAALDPILTGEVLKVIQEMKDGGKDFIFVTHELKFLRNFADYILFMESGQVVEAGPAVCLDAPKTELLKIFVKGEA
ncbi:MAG: amino acid ABC transporter ATP-binding protein [Ruminococcus sp.]|jgi:ABC-type polar amino acid transport system ATPase subunit